MMDNNFDLNESEQPKSKTQLKAEMNELQALGEKLVNLSPAILASLPLSTGLLDAVTLAQRIKNTREGFRRQLQFIGKLMRQEQIDELRLALDKLEGQHQAANQHFHMLEKTREAILRDGDSAINALLAEHPQLDRQKLRALARQAKKQAEKNQPPKATREIFQYLKANITEG